MTEEQLNAVGSGGTDSTSQVNSEALQWSPLASLPVLPSYSQAFNMAGNFVCVVYQIKETRVYLKRSLIGKLWKTKSL